jgi:hypothetical protein
MSQPQNAKLQSNRVNGLDVQAAYDTIDAIKADNGLAKFQFRARNAWIDGGANRSTIRDFYGAGREDDSRLLMANRRFCWATTRAPIPWNSCCTPSLDA